LRYAHILQEGFEWFTATDKYFAQEVEKRTNGKVKIKLYWAESLGKTSEMLGLVKNGTVDVAAMYLGVFPSAFPLWSASNSLFFVMSTLDEAHQVAVQIPEKVQGVQDEIRKQNVKLLYHHLLPSYHLWAKKPVVKFEDLSGLKLRSFGVHLPHIYKAAGAVGVTVLHPEIYEPLERGVIDGGMLPSPLADGVRLQNIIKHVSLWDLGSIAAYGVFINLDKWNRLSPDVRSTIEQVAKDTGVFAHKHAVEMDSRIVKKLKDAGVQFHEVPVAEKKKWIDSSPNFLDEWVKDMDKIGKGEPARQMKNLWLEIVQKY
jgi:TRAP-type C4-dicarboxylate transport system substrate-binding protein